jgi:hypothetical protein
MSGHLKAEQIGDVEGLSRAPSRLPPRQHVGGISTSREDRAAGARPGPLGLSFAGEGSQRPGHSASNAGSLSHGGSGRWWKGSGSRNGRKQEPLPSNPGDANARARRMIHHGRFPPALLLVTIVEGQRHCPKRPGQTATPETPALRASSDFRRAPGARKAKAHPWPSRKSVRLRTVLNRGLRRLAGACGRAQVCNGGLVVRDS